MSTTSSGASKLGVNLALAGLSFQVFTLVVFCALFADYLLRLWRHHSRGEVPSLSRRMRAFLGFLGVAVVLILARCIFRVDELSEGYSGPLVANETLFIVFEGV